MKIFKFYILFIFTALWVNYSFCQTHIQSVYTDKYKVLDTVRYEITYEVSRVSDADDTTKKDNDIHKLLIGSHISKTESYLKFQNDSLCVIAVKQGKENVPSQPKKASTYEIYKNRDTKTVNFIDINPLFVSDFYWYEESIPEINWQIHGDKKIIAGYSCQKATTKFRGREYEAWFTFDIPVSDGPYKFTGLPGLILEIYDSQSHYSFKCTGIKSPNSVQLITIRDWVPSIITRTTREKYNTIIKKGHDDPVGYAEARGITLMGRKDGKLVPMPKDYSYPYNPIELE
ncbi:MAG: GLPGLI family protein [Bacteroidales bacterium]|nr:GLPGLI family protein [Bacteroidales bacterium]